MDVRSPSPTFSKNANFRDEDLNSNSQNSKNPQFKITKASSYSNSNDNTRKQNVEMQRSKSPLRAAFTIGDEIDDDIEEQTSSTVLNTRKKSEELRNKSSQDNHHNITSNLQNMFAPPNESPRRNYTSNSLNVFKGKVIRPKSPTSYNLTPISQSDSDRYEDINQLTAHSITTDFIAPARPVWREERNARANDGNPYSQEPRPSWYVRLLRFFKKGRTEVNISIFKHIVKSAIAFFLASLIVIVEPINNAIGSTSFMAPIVTIFFDNSHTIGAQLEISFLTCCFMLVGLVYYLLAFGLFITYNRYMVPADAPNPIKSDGSFILAIFFFVAIFFLGWLRAKFTKFSTPSSLLSLILLIVMTNIHFGEKQFDFDFFGKTLAASLIGIGISFFINIILWPESASQDLGKSIDITLHNALLSIKTLTSCFLLDEDTLTVTVSNLEDLHTRSMNAVNTLIRAGKEARYEYTYSVHPPTDYKELTNIILTLQQQLGGFNLSIQRERQLLTLNKPKEDQRISPLSSRNSSYVELKGLSLPPSPSALSLSKMAEDLIPVTPEVDPVLARSLIHDIIHFVKDPLLSLTRHCTLAIEAASKSLAEENALDVMEPEAVDSSDKNCCCHHDQGSLDSSVSHNCSHEDLKKESIDLKDLGNIAQMLEASISEFENAEGRCLHLIHQQLLFTPHLHSPFPESMLIVFSGIFSVREFAKELVKLLKEIPRFQKLRPVRAVGSGILRTGPARQKKMKSWWRPRVGFSKWLQGYRATEEPRQAEHYTTEPNISDEIGAINKEFSVSQEELNAEEDPLQLPNQKWTKPEYGYASPPLNSLNIRIQQKIWKTFRRFNTYEHRFGFKLTLTMIILTFPAFIPVLSKDYLQIWKGHWGAISALSILNQTIGGTLSTGIARFSGTIIGAIWGFTTHVVNVETKNIYLVIIMIWIFNAPAWYTIMTTSYSRVGINGLVAYCLVLFVDYNKNNHQAMFQVALLRTVSVAVGLVVAMIISSTLWPYVARKEVRKLVAGLMADMGVNFGKVATLCMSPQTESRKELDQQIKSQQYSLQKRIMSTKTLLVFAEKEPRFKGPFPIQVYREQLRVLQDILDQLVAMRGAVIQISPEVQSTVIFPFNSYRKFMVSSVILYFYVLAGALLAKHPLPPYPPPIHAIRYKLMLKTRSAMIRKFRRSHGRPVSGGLTSIRRDMSMNALTESLNGSGTSSGTSSPQIISAVNRRDFNHIYWYTYMAGLVRLFEDVELLGHNVAGLVGEANLTELDQVIIRHP